MQAAIAATNTATSPVPGGGSLFGEFTGDVTGENGGGLVFLETAVDTVPAEPVSQAVPWVQELDGFCRRLALLRHQVSVPVARAAATLVRHQLWRKLRPSLGDFAREELQCSAAWVRQHALVHEGIAQHPELERALCGTDGGAALGFVATLHLARALRDERITDIQHWIARARSLTVRELHEALRQLPRKPAAKSDVAGDVAGGVAGGDAGGDAGRVTGDVAGGDVRDSEPQSEEAAQVSLRVPVFVESGFDRAKQLHDRIEGRTKRVSELIESLLAEVASGDCGAEDSGKPIDAEVRLRRSSESLEKNWRKPQHQELPELRASCTQTRRAEQVLRQFATVCHSFQEEEQTDLAAASPIVVRGFLARFREILEIQRKIELRIGELLLELDRVPAWRSLGYNNLGHYAEERLGMSRPVASARAQMARRLCSMPRVRAAYEAGRICLEKAQLVDQAARHAERHACAVGGVVPDGVQFDTHGGVVLTGEFESAWLERARWPVKHLQDDVRAVRRRMEWSDFDRQAPRSSRDRRRFLPPKDDEWLQSIRFEPTGCRDWFLETGLRAVVHLRDAPITAVHPLRWWLPESLAYEFLGAIEARRRKLEDLVPGLDRLDAAEEARLMPSVRICRMFTLRKRGRVPAWLGLWSILEECADVWDDGRASASKVLARDGYRCTVPGCTAMRWLQRHHIVYRSHSNCHKLWNLTALCYFHHMLGEHGGLLRVRGKAPFDLVWRLGPPGLESWYADGRKLSQQEIDKLGLQE